MTTTQKVAAGAATLLAVAAVGVGTSAVISDSSSPTVAAAATTTTTQSCNDWGVSLTTGECQAAGTIRYVGLYNMQGSAQFCKWKPANPGEWSRLNDYAGTGTQATNIVSWYGASVQNWLQAYFGAGGPPMRYTLPNGTTVAGIQPNTSKSACKTPLAPPIVQGVTPGQTDATVTIGG